MRKFERAVLCVSSAMAFTVLAVLPLPAIADQIQIFDGSNEPDTAEPSASESKLVKTAVTPGARGAWPDNECDFGFDLRSRCKGAFTRKGVKQEAYLYSWCSTGHNLGISGLAVMQKGKLVAHFGWEGGGEYDVVRLPDLDGNGLDELAIVAGGTNHGYAINCIAIVGIRSGAVKKFGRFETFNAKFGTDETDPDSVAWVVTASPAKRPIFWRQKLKRAKNRWVKSGKSTKSTPDRDHVTYDKL